MGPLRAAYLKANYWLARKITSHLVSDSKELQQLYLEEYGTPSAFLTYGAHVEHVEDEARASRDPRDLRRRTRWLLPRRRAHGAGEQRRRHRPRVRAVEPQGAAARRGRRQLQERVSRAPATDDGPAYPLPRPGLRARPSDALHLGAKAYLHGHEVGGTNPSLLGAMGCGNLVLAHDVRFNREVLAGTGLLWSKDEGSLRASSSASTGKATPSRARPRPPVASGSPSSTPGTSPQPTRSATSEFVTGSGPGVRVPR